MLCQFYIGIIHGIVFCIGISVVQRYIGISVVPLYFVYLQLISIKRTGTC